MAHRQQQAFVATIKMAFPSYFAGSRVLEVGSLNINGSVRQHFSGGQYIGLDVGPGPGVDVVCQGQDYDAPDGSFDVVISCECLEHNPFWRETFENMLRLCRPGGLVIMTCASTGAPRALHPPHHARRCSPDRVGLLPQPHGQRFLPVDCASPAPHDVEILHRPILLRSLLRRVQGGCGSAAGRPGSV